jgi:hypothetical protein
MEKGYGNDIYGSGDFDQIKNKVHYSICHGEDHTMNRHKHVRFSSDTTRLVIKCLILHATI